MTTKQIAEVVGMVLTTIRDQERATTDKAQEVGKTVDAVEAIAEASVEKKARPKKAKAKKPKPQLHIVGSGKVELTPHLWRVWVAIKALLNAESNLASEGSPDNGFTTVSASAKFVTQFMGREFWLHSAVNSVGGSMGRLKDKGLLNWDERNIPTSKGRSVRINLRLGPLA